MAKNSQHELTGLLEIQLVASRSGPTKRLMADLHDVAAMLDRARNAMVMAWLRWRWEHQDWSAPVVLGKDGKTKLRKNGQPIVDKSGYAPKRVLFDYTLPNGGPGAGTPCGEGEGVTFPTYLYHCGRVVARTVYGSLFAMLSGEVVSNLTTNVSHNHGGKYLHRWQAILDNAEQIPTFRNGTIPVPNNSAGFVYCGHGTGGQAKSADLHKHGNAAAAIQIPLFSRESGRKVVSPIATLRIGSMSPGNRLVMQRIARGEWKWSDSRLVFKKDRWQIQFTYKQPSRSLGLDQSRVATLWPTFGTEHRPFVVESKDANRHWFVGNGTMMKVAVERVEARRKGIRNTYRFAVSGMKGHGRKRMEMRLRPTSKRAWNLQRQFVRQLVNEVVKFCRSNNCGTVVYREPYLGTRDSLWLALNKAPCDWTSLMSDLSNTMRYYGIKLEVAGVSCKDLRERFGDSAKATLSIERKPVPAKEEPSETIDMATRKAEMDAAKQDGAKGSKDAKHSKGKDGKPLADGDAKPAAAKGINARRRKRGWQ